MHHFADQNRFTSKTCLKDMPHQKGAPPAGGGVRGPSGPTRETPGRAAGAKHHVLPTGLIAARDGA